MVNNENEDAPCNQSAEKGSAIKRDTAHSVKIKGPITETIPRCSAEDREINELVEKMIADRRRRMRR